MKNDIGFTAVKSDAETIWPFRGMIHGSARLARHYITKATFPKMNQDKMWKKLKSGGWKIVKVKISKVS